MQTSGKKHAEHCLTHVNKTAWEIWSIFDKVHFWVKTLTPFFHRSLQLVKHVLLVWERDELPPFLATELWSLFKPLFCSTLLFLKSRNILAWLLLDPRLWPCEDGWGRNDRLCCNTVVQSTRDHAQLDALQPNRLLHTFILTLWVSLFGPTPVHVCTDAANIILYSKNYTKPEWVKIPPDYTQLDLYTLVAYQANLIEQWWTSILRYPWRDQASLICRQRIPKRCN